nr:flagellar protein FlhE [Halomonas socia]
MKAWLGALVVVLASASWVQAATPAVSGSWVAQTEGVRVAVPGREIHSRALRGAAPPDAQIARISWQYATPPGALLEAWLCHPQRCLRLNGARGQSEGLAGLSAAQPLHFRFRLGQDARPVQVNGLQVIVDHRRPAAAKAQKTVGQ